MAKRHTTSFKGSKSAGELKLGDPGERLSALAHYLMFSVPMSCRFPKLLYLHVE